MAIVNDNGGMYMPVAPAYGGGGGGFGDFGGGWWIILLLLCGWGGMGMGGWGGMGNMQLGYDFPWLLNGQNNINANTNGGFRDQMLHDTITGVGEKVSSGFNSLQAQLYNGQLADLERSFNAQTANSQGLNALQAQMAQCCCENRAATADLKYTVATENCADRTAAYQNTRDIIDSQTRGTQAILDKLCQLELDGYKREADNLRAQLSDAKIAASQASQNAFIQKGFSDEVDALYNRLSNCPVPSTPVYGRTPIFQCNNGGYGCAA